MPARALLDKELTLTDLRVLGAVASFDWMSGHRGRGAGCILSVRQLAQVIEAHFSNVQKSISALTASGYLESEPMKVGRATRSLRVVYNDDDRQIFDRVREGRTVGPATNSDTCESVGRPTNTDGQRSVGSATNGTEKTVGPATNSEAVKCRSTLKNFDENSIAYSRKETPRRGGRDLAKQGNKFCETAQRFAQREASQKLVRLSEKGFPIGETAALLSQIDEASKLAPLDDPEIFAALEMAAMKISHLGVSSQIARVMIKQVDEDAYTAWMRSKGRYVPGDEEPARHEVLQ